MESWELCDDEIAGVIDNYTEWDLASKVWRRLATAAGQKAIKWATQPFLHDDKITQVLLDSLPDEGGIVHGVIPEQRAIWLAGKAEGRREMGREVVEWWWLSKTDATKEDIDDFEAWLAQQGIEEGK
jgi:hypothetical protein